VREARQAVSPARQAVSPVRQAASPARQAVSPVRQAVSPARQAVSPALQAASPARAQPEAPDQWSLRIQGSAMRAELEVQVLPEPRAVAQGLVQVQELLPVLVRAPVPALRRALALALVRTPRPVQRLAQAPVVAVVAAASAHPSCSWRVRRESP
jgi:hypothetical protein